jgi:calcineurin-like phosphoesterase family protein
MTKTFVFSDPHFSHANIVKFNRYNGDKLRPWDDVDEMDKQLISNYNEKVKDGDKVYWLGDVAFKAAHLHAIMPQLNGDKVLIKGNHDQEKLSVYAQYFRDIRAYHQLDGVFLSHIPIHPSSLGRWGKQVHGHLHAEQVLLDNGDVDLRYLNVSVERTGFAPMDWEDVLDEFDRRGIARKRQK